MRRRTFRAMGTEVELVIEAVGDAAEAAFDAAEQEVRHLESVLSRFDRSSELSRLNRDGRLVPGPDLIRVVGAALDGRRRSDGRFDPTVLPALRSAGYDRDLQAVAADDPGPAGDPVPAGGRVHWDTTTGELILGPGVQIDLGGIAKGDAADRAAAILGRTAPALAVVGGDVSVTGPRSDGTGWPVAVEGGPVLSIRGGGLATSGVDRRRWIRGGRQQHHVIDPATGAPAQTDLLRATAAGASATDAEVLATDLLLLGRDAGRRRAEALGIPAVLTDERGAQPAGVLA